MNKKARLIKREDAAALEAAKRNRLLKKPVVKKTVEAVADWIETQRAERPDPRKAFAALFAQPQPQ
jgi:hypothetical protein